MEKAVLKTLAYYDIFNFPLKAWEVHKWLISKSINLNQIEKTLKKLKLKGKVQNQGDFWFLSRRGSIVKDRQKKEKISASHFKKAKNLAVLFKLIPTVKLAGISGSLAMSGSTKKDDIDLFIITEKNRIWISRLMLVALTSLLGLRRKRHEKKLSASGKICINLILESDNLALDKKNIYLAHEVLQMTVLWQRDGLYSKFLSDNGWAFKFLPNWKSNIKIENSAKKQKNNSGLKTVDWLEQLSKRFQLQIMGNPDNAERIESGALYFHPENKGVKILEEYKRRLKKLSLS